MYNNNNSSYKNLVQSILQNNQDNIKIFTDG